MIFWLFWWLCRRKCNLSCDFNESECSRFLKVGMFSQLSQLRSKYIKYLLCHTTLNTSLYLWRLSWIHYPKTNNFFTIIIENKERKKKDTHTITHKQGFLEVLYFFSWLVMPFFLFGAKFTGLKFYRWRYDNWPIGQWVIFLVVPNTSICLSFFLATRPRVLVARSAASDLMHWSSLRSLLRTY